MGNFCEQFKLSPIAHSRKNRKKPDKVLRKKLAPYYNNYKKRRFYKPSTSNIFLKNPRNPKRKGNLNLINMFPKENVSIVENQDILLTNAQNHPKRLNKKLML